MKSLPYPWHCQQRLHLPATLHSQLEIFFGFGLSRLQVQVNSLPASMGCIALTTGERVLVREGWDPTGLEGRYVIAHEVTHVLQQRFSRVAASAVPWPQLVFDPVLELEAEVNGWGFACGALDQAVFTGDKPLEGESWANPGLQLQPVVTIFGSINDRKGVEYRAKKFQTLWNLVRACNHFKKARPKPKVEEIDLLKRKLLHWVSAPKKAGFTSFRKKGHDKQFVGVNNLSRALFGRVYSRGAKKLEAQFAEAIGSSAQVNKLLTQGVKKLFMFHKANLTHFKDTVAQLKLRDDPRATFGRYADYYSPAKSKLRYISKFKKEAWAQPRTYDKAFTYILSGKKKVSNFQIAAFLCDYSMIARWFFERHLDGFFFSDRDKKRRDELQKLMASAKKKKELIDEAKDEAFNSLMKQIKDMGYEGYKEFIEGGDKNEQIAEDYYADKSREILEEKARRYAEDHVDGILEEEKITKRINWFARFKHEEARSPLGSKSNVNETHPWVKRARAKGIRLGAGPSATAMQVLQMFQVIYPHNETKLAVALALFEFWNRHMTKKVSEIHTWHEVMVVAVEYCSDRRLLPGQLEYPSLEDFRGWLKDPFQKVVLTTHETRHILKKMEKKERLRRGRLKQKRQQEELIRLRDEALERRANTNVNPLLTKPQRRKVKINRGKFV